MLSAMYQPAHFRCEEFAHARRFMAEQPLALLIGPDAQGESFGSHLPLSLLELPADAQGQPAWCLEGHMARANPHWAWLAGLLQAGGPQVLAVFSGPGAYVSPRHYDSLQNVPTWNYMAVHVYGELELVDGAEAKDALLKRLITSHEPAYAEQWRGLSPDYQQRLLGAIVGFRLHIRRWEAKFKLSQNRSAAERQRIRAAWSEGGHPREQELAAWMERLGL